MIVGPHNLSWPYFAMSCVSASGGRVFALDTFDDRVEVRELVPQPMGC